MAIGHIAVRTHNRGRGHTAAAALAYRAGAALTCSRTGEIHDYRRREQDGQIAHTGIYAPVKTPLVESLDALAAAIETAERRQKSRICRDVQMALPAELDEPDRVELAQEFAELLAARYNTVAALAVHRPDTAGDERNHHAHVILPTRALDDTGQLGAKLRVLDQVQTSHVEIREIRALWEATANAKLRERGIAAAHVHTGRTEDPAPTLGARDTAIERNTRSAGGPPGVSVADLVADGRSVTPRGRRLQRHERRTRKDRGRRRRREAGPTLEEHRAVPAAETRPTPAAATRAALSAPSAVPAAETSPTPATATRAALSAPSAAPAARDQPDPGHGHQGSPERTERRPRGRDQADPGRGHQGSPERTERRSRGRDQADPGRGHQGSPERTERRPRGRDQPDPGRGHQGSPERTERRPRGRDQPDPGRGHQGSPERTERRPRRPRPARPRPRPPGQP